MRRFRLTSLLAAMFTASVLIGVNCYGRWNWAGPLPGYGLRGAYHHGVPFVAVVYPATVFRYEEGSARPRESKELPKTTAAYTWRWTDEGLTRFDRYGSLHAWPCVGNVVFLILCSAAVLVGVEYVLRRRAARGYVAPSGA